MLAMMLALYNGNEVNLVFCSKEDATNFKAFVNAYMARGGNGYNAYWVFVDTEIIAVDKVPENSVTLLDGRYVDGMYQDILKRNLGVDVSMKSGQKNSAIAFEFYSLTPVATVAKS